VGARRSRNTTWLDVASGLCKPKITGKHTKNYGKSKIFIGKSTTSITSVDVKSPFDSWVNQLFLWPGFDSEL
jgi:hypothetical protein